LAHGAAHVALALAQGRGRLRRSDPALLAADASFIRALHYYAPLGGYRCLAAECASPVQITEVCLRVKVYGGYHSGRVVVLPAEARAGDFITLPLDLPAGEMFQPGRTHPNLHRTKITYKLLRSIRDAGSMYLSCVADAPRFIRSVTVPPVPATGITITL
jgi:hypothetical protein